MSFFHPKNVCVNLNDERYKPHFNKHSLMNLLQKIFKFFLITIWCVIGYYIIILWNHQSKQPIPDFMISPKPLKLIYSKHPNVAYVPCPKEHFN